MKKLPTYRTPEYQAWMKMIVRCEVPTDPSYHWYGGRGVAVCAEWRHSFAAFLAHVGHKPSPKHSLDRWPNPNGDYDPGNVRWATNSQQHRNMRSNRWLEFNGKKMIAADWAAHLGMSRQSLARRLKIYPVEVALAVPKADLHATAADKIKALAIVLRPVVEKVEK